VIVISNPKILLSSFWREGLILHPSFWGEERTYLFLERSVRAVGALLFLIIDVHLRSADLRSADPKKYGRQTVNRGYWVPLHSHISAT
jgi:hypothetical protein